ncbi:MAG TPA: hypothetical protein VHO49_04060 [Anaerolineales bacterium]|nr:hypothetical protein [Anaerolineales bacterium]
MLRRVLLILILSCMLTSCGGAAPAPTEAPVEPPSVTEEPTQPLIADTPTPADTATPLPTNTPLPTSTPAPTSTETPLPTLVLPTEVVNPPIRSVWDGTPTYPGDSASGYAFRITYDPEVWALTLDQFGYPALGHRTLSGCVISVTSGRGLPPSMTVEHETLEAGDVTFDVGIAYENGVKKFATFTGGDRRIITAFQVSFLEESDACLADAVAVLSTLRSIPVSQATPSP